MHDFATNASIAGQRTQAVVSRHDQVDDVSNDLPLIAPPSGSAMWRPDFLFGAATASYQIEGAAHADGRVPSIWDTFCATPGKVHLGDNGAVACDHYHRYASDLALLKSLGFDAYRFSIAWPRVMDASGKLNERGIDFYKRLLDACDAQGLRSYATLYHCTCRSTCRIAAAGSTARRRSASRTTPKR